MKKLTSCLIAAVSAFAGISSVAAAGSCTIKEAPDQALQDYLKGIDNLVTAAANQGGKGNCQTPEDGSRTATSDVNKAQSSVIGSVNKALTTSNVVTSFRYTVNLIRRTELPAGIRRDHAQLDRRQRALMSAIDAVSSSCGSETVFESDVSPYAPYSTEGRTVGKVLEEALTNHTDVMELYRETVLWDEPAKINDLILVPPGFAEKIKKAYGPEGIEACNTSGDDTFFEKVKKSVDRIGKLGDNMQTGTQDWKDAWALLQWNHKKQDRVEKDLLRKELSRQGLSTSASERMTRNLDAYNRGEGWQGMNSSLQGIGEAVNNGVAVVQGLYEEAKEVGAQYAGAGGWSGQPKPEDAKDTNEYMERQKNLADLKTDVGQEIQKEYMETLSLISDENVSVDNNVGQLLEMHVILSKTLKTIDPFKKTSSDTCKVQAANVPANCNGE